MLGQIHGKTKGYRNVPVDSHVDSSVIFFEFPVLNLTFIRGHVNLTISCNGCQTFVGIPSRPFAAEMSFGDIRTVDIQKYATLLGNIVIDISAHPNSGSPRLRRVKDEMRDTSGLMFMGNARLIQGASRLLVFGNFAIFVTDAAKVITVIFFGILFVPWRFGKPCKCVRVTKDRNLVGET